MGGMLCSFTTVRPPPTSTLFPYTTLFRSLAVASGTRLTPTSITTAPGLTMSALTNSATPIAATRSEEHTSELQSPVHLVCRLLLEKKNTEDVGDTLVIV